MLEGDPKREGGDGILTRDPPQDPPPGGEGIKGKGLPFDSMTTSITTWLDSPRVDELLAPERVSREAPGMEEQIE